VARIGIIGSRRRNTGEDFRVCENAFLSAYKEGDELVSGGCPKGGDEFCYQIAKKYGIPIKIYFPNWDKYGKGAGFVRNTKIAEDSDIIIAVVHPDRSGGTEDTIKKAEKLGKKIILVPAVQLDKVDDIPVFDSSILSDI